MALVSKPLSIANVVNGQNGKDGIAGKDGVGLSSTSITYAQSTSGTIAPTTGWSAQVPTLVKGQYLWTRTVWTYTDNTNETGYTVSYNAKDGNDGTDGKAGKDGVGISSTVVEYATSASGTVKPTSGWSTTIPAVSQGQYLWTRTTWNYTDSTSEQGFSVARQGVNGQNGQAAPTVTAVQVEYTQSLDGVTPPTSGWTGTKPTPNMGYWQWQRVRDVFSNGTYGTWVATSVYYGRDAIIISATEPTPKVDNMLWQKPNDPTVLRWNGSAWVEWGISVDNLVVDNATIENGVFKRIEGVEVIGSTIRNPYTREYLGGVRRDGEITLSEAEFKNSGKMYIDDVLKETYEQVISDRYIRMVRYRGDNFGDENNLIGSATLTFDTLTLVSKGEGVLDHGGSLTARQLTNTQWINLTYATGFRTSENNPCQYRLIYDLQDNPVVQFRGQVERTTGLMTGTTYPFTTLPPAIRTTKNVFKACTGDATELQTIRVGALKGDMGSVSNMIQIKAVGATQYVDISGLSYIVE